MQVIALTKRILKELLRDTRTLLLVLVIVITQICIYSKY